MDGCGRPGAGRNLLSLLGRAGAGGGGLRALRLQTQPLGGLRDQARFQTLRLGHHCGGSAQGRDLRRHRGGAVLPGWTDLGSTAIHADPVRACGAGLCGGGAGRTHPHRQRRRQWPGDAVHRGRGCRGRIQPGGRHPIDGWALPHRGDRSVRDLPRDRRHPAVSRHPAVTLVDQNWITLAGQPIGGRTPTQTLVFGNPMNSAQSGWVRQAYHQFCTEKLTSTGQYLMRGAQFADGTRIRITSINGVDTVRVWTPGVPQEYELQAAFSWKWAPDSGEFGGGVLLLPSKEIKLIDEVPDSYQWDPSLSADDRKGCGVARKNAAAIGAAIGVERKPFCTNEAAGSYLYGWSATAHNGPYVDWARTFTTLPNDTSLGGVFVGQQSAGSAAFAAMAYRDRLFTASAVVSGGAYVLAVATAKIDFSADPEFSSVTVTGMPAGIGRMEGSFNPKQKRLELVAYKNGSDGWNWRGHVDFTLEGGEWVGAASGSFTYPTILTDTYVVVGPHAKPTISIDKDMGRFSASASDPDG